MISKKNYILNENDLYRLMNRAYRDAIKGIEFDFKKIIKQLKKEEI